MQEIKNIILNISAEEVDQILKSSSLIFKSIKDDWLNNNVKEVVTFTNTINQFVFATEHIDDRDKAWEALCKRQGLIHSFMCNFKRQIVSNIFFSLDIYNSLFSSKEKNRFFITFDSTFLTSLIENKIVIYKNDIDKNFDFPHYFTSDKFLYKIIMLGLNSSPNLIAKLTFKLDKSHIFESKKHITLSNDCMITYKIKIPSLLSHIESIIYLDNINNPINLTDFYIKK